MAAVENASKVTEEQLQRFLDICWVKYVKAKIEPGIEPGSFVYSYVLELNNLL